MGTDLLRVQANERIDLEDWEFALDERMQTNERQLFEQFMQDPAGTQAQILDGFNISNPAGSQLQVAKGQAILSVRKGGVVYTGMLTSAGDATKTLDLSAYTPATYNIYVRFEWVEGSDQSRIFWNPAGSGSEFAQTIATKKAANWGLRVETSSPGNEWLLIGTVAQATMTITDLRPLYYEGTVGTYATGWGTGNDRNSDRQQYGVKDLHTFTKAMRQCVEDVKGRGLREWYEEDIGGFRVGFTGNSTEDRIELGDTNCYWDNGGTNPYIRWDAGNDDLIYIRSTNEWVFQIGGSNQLVIGPGYTLYAATDSELRFDTGDYFKYIDATNDLEFYIGSARKLVFDGTGLAFDGGLFVGDQNGTPVTNRIYVGDTECYFGNSGGAGGILAFDGGDYLNYASDIYDFFIGNVSEMKLADAGMNILNGLVVGDTSTTPIDDGLIVTGGAVIGHTGSPIADVLTVGDVSFGLRYNSGNPRIEFATGDYVEYNRSNNALFMSWNNMYISNLANPGSTAEIKNVTPNSNVAAQCYVNGGVSPTLGNISWNVASVAYVSTGAYDVTLTQALSYSSGICAIATPDTTGAGGWDKTIAVLQSSTTVFRVRITDVSAGTDSDSDFSFVVFGY